MRCAALASVMIDAGWDVVFAISAETLRMSGSRLPLSSEKRVVAGDVQHEPDALGALVGDCDLLVVDHYDRGMNFETACRAWSKRIAAIDDMPIRNHDCDILLDSGADEFEAKYSALVPSGCRILLGSKYALVAEQFLSARKRQEGLTAKTNVETIFVSFGASDPKGATLVALEAIKKAGLGARVIVAIGSSSDRLSELKQYASDNVEVHLDADNMSELMSESDLAIGAGGSTSWERCCVGLPSIVIKIAKNQNAIAETLVRNGAAICLGDFEQVDSNGLADAIRSLAADHLRRSSMRSRSLTVVDGLGGRRLLEALSC